MASEIPDTGTSDRNIDSGKVKTLHQIKSIAQHFRNIHLREREINGSITDLRLKRLLIKNADEFNKIQEGLDTLWEQIK